jgi:hypothetical protein
MKLVVKSVIFFIWTIYFWGSLLSDGHIILTFLFIIEFVLYSQGYWFSKLMFDVEAHR